MPERPPFVVLVTGPESSGKSTLARDLAWTLDGRYVPEYARAYLNRTGGAYGPDDLPRIHAGQAEAEAAARASSASFVVCDTGPFVLYVWAEIVFGGIPPLPPAALRRPYDLVLLCAPDLPWMPDPLREAPEAAARAALFARYRALLAEHRPGKVVVIRGSERLGAALGAIGETIRL